ncbi:MAG TPA: NBR1-Ig-like domain-containing protein, partial [Caldilineaceae bacterium]|nr:NBR1-Ig-like domain-containing protein [Caldilineaceae bacterium]
MSNFRFEVWPTEQKVITQHFGARPGYYAQFGLPGHEGLDFAAPPDSRVFCVAPGVVRRVLTDGGPYGVNVRVAHPDGYETIYAHLKQANVTEGQELRAGDVVGLAGMTGNTDGPHLHLTLKNHNGAQSGYPNNIVDPTPFIRHLLDPNRDEAQYIRDTVPDGTVLQPGVEFAQTWFMRNSGTTTWGMGYALRLVSGDALGAPPQVTVPPAPPNAEVPVSVSFRTPTTPGRHRSTWRLADPEGNLFGPPVWVEVVVPDASVTTPTTPTGPLVQRRGNEFFVNGQPFRFIGVNMRGLLHYGRRQSDPLRFSRLEHRASQLEAAQNMGARVVRFFVPDRDASADEIEQRFREVVELVKSRFPQLYLLPAFTNLYGDVPFHVPGDEGFYTPPPSGGGSLLNREFYAEGYRRNYLPLVQRIVSAFRGEPAIFAWEIGNELKLDRGNLGDPNDPNPRLFINFNLAAAAAIKQIDPHHLVTTGMKSTHHAWLHTAELQEALYASPNIDFITIHSYEGIYDQEGDRRVYEDVAVA